MPKRFKLTPEQEETRKYYEEVGWPASLTKADLVIYEMKSPETLDTYFLSREDCPSIKMERGILISKKGWDKFRQVIEMGREYK